MGVTDDKVLIFVNFYFGQCWKGTVHYSPPSSPHPHHHHDHPAIRSLYHISQLVEFQTVNIHITLGLFCVLKINIIIR